MPKPLDPLHKLTQHRDGLPRLAHEEGKGFTVKAGKLREFDDIHPVLT